MARVLTPLHANEHLPGNSEDQRGELLQTYLLLGVLDDPLFP
jgi:hypothetical protein